MGQQRRVSDLGDEPLRGLPIAAEQELTSTPRQQHRRVSRTIDSRTQDSESLRHLPRRTQLCSTTEGRFGEPTAMLCSGRLTAQLLRQFACLLKGATGQGCLRLLTL